jgi:hypothetical protein
MAVRDAFGGLHHTERAVVSPRVLLDDRQTL